MALTAVPLRSAETQGVLERSVKAAFVYKFLGFIEWPEESFASPVAPIVVGVYGGDDIAGELTQVVPGKAIGSRPVEIRRIGDPDSLRGLHALFIGRADNARIARLARIAQQLSIVTITEADGALDSGSVINLVVSDGRVRFEVALDTAEKSRLKLSSRLLALAVHVRGAT